MAFGNIVVTKFDLTNAATLPAAGYRKVSFVNAGATDITFDGRVYPPGKGECYPEVLNATYGPMAYDANGGTIWFTGYAYTQ